MTDRDPLVATLDPVVLARELYHLEQRLGRTEERVDQIDATGTRGVIGLTVQITELTKNLGRIEAELQRLQASTANSARYWVTTVLTVLALLATVAIAYLK